MTDESLPGVPAKLGDRQAKKVARIQPPEGPVLTRAVEHGTVELTEEGYRLLHDLGEEGVSMNAVAAVFSIGRTTLQQLLKRDPRAAEAFGKGRARLERALVSRLVSEAKDPDQKNPAFLLFAHKALLGIDEKGPTEAKASNINIQINLPAAAKDASEFAKVINPEPGPDADQ